MDTARMDMWGEDSETESEERETEWSPSATSAIGVPFQQQVPLEILTMIISHADRGTLAACLRISKLFFHLAGQKLYTRIEIVLDTGWAEIMRGAGVGNTTPDGSNDEASRSEDTTRPLKINYKRLLLEYVHTIVTRDHCCPGISPASVKESAKMMTGLKSAIFAPGAHCYGAAAFDNGDDWCKFAKVFVYESLTIHIYALEILPQGYFGPFTTMLGEVRHITLVVPPTSHHSVYQKTIEAELYRRPPPNLSSLRLLFAGYYRTGASCIGTRHHWVSVESLIESVGSYLTLANWDIEIYIFNDFDNTLDLVDVREKLKSKVDDAIKALPDKDRPDWTPNYQVYGLEENFNDHDMYLELDHEWTIGWHMELDRRQRAQREEAEQSA